VASRGFVFFMTPEECEDAICQIARDMSLWMVLENFSGSSTFECRKNAKSLQSQNGKLAERIWFSAQNPKASLRHMKAFTPAKFGWVMLYPNRIQNRVLLMAQLSAKSDWLDAKRGQICENPESIGLFEKIARRLRKMLPFSARNRWSGDPEWLDAKVPHSRGVVEWVKSGGSINQLGVANIDYTIDETTE
jgi:hypothetical protein